ncbi:transcription factor ATOH8 [Pelobates fuscus]|uniref:transcription factor ATOH8 n=1 Tax=Pelobates fuscus TaxID=191477 RepID=UPI002FE4B9B7
MKKPQVLQESPWKTHCIKDIQAVKRLKRKNREVNGFRSFKVDMKVEEVVVGAGQRSPAAATTSSAVTAATAAGRLEMMSEEEEDCPEALDLRNGALVAAPAGSSLAKQGLMKAGGLLDGFGEQRLQPRIMVCQRPPDSSYLSVTYNKGPDSPRTRLGETAGVSTEIKAIQQTRRLLANARERTRVHTISAAFEALRKQVPCYSYGQKLSKLAILRIACNYILSLARLADLDYSADHSNLSFSECVEQCTRTLQSEGRSKKRKE